MSCRLLQSALAHPCISRIVPINASKRISSFEQNLRADRPSSSAGTLLAKHRLIMSEQSEFNKLPEQVVEKLDEVKKEVASYTEDAFSAVEKYVRDNPWQAIGIAALAAAVFTLLSRSRR